MYTILAWSLYNRHCIRLEALQSRFALKEGKILDVSAAHPTIGPHIFITSSLVHFKPIAMQSNIPTITILRMETQFLCSFEVEHVF